MKKIDKLILIERKITYTWKNIGPLLPTTQVYPLTLMPHPYSITPPTSIHYHEPVLSPNLLA
jgi:hypothetical protein